MPEKLFVNMKNQKESRESHQMMYSSVTVSDLEKYNTDLQAFIDVVIELHKFNDEMLSPVIKDLISSYVYILVGTVDRRSRKRHGETACIKIPDIYEAETEYVRYKKTNPLILVPGFVNFYDDYSKISFPNCSGL